MKSTNDGFTLLELMIVVAVVAILAAIAIPSYQSSIAKSRRADAQSALQGFAQAMERFHTQNATYVGAGTTGTGNVETGPPTIFATKSPIDGSQTFYNLTIRAADANSYELLATAVNGQAGDGNLELFSTGRRGWDRDNNGGFGSADQCWEITCN